jgi:hypothetical protein
MNPRVFEFGTLNVLMVPWICEENEKECLEAIRTAKTEDVSHVIGHFHLKGFNIGTGQVAEDGHDGNIFDGYEEVASGHFHTLSEKKISKKTTVRYLSCPYEMTWSDWNDPKGFHLLDTDTGKYTFFRNPKRLFNKILWSEVPRTGGYSDYAGTYCRVIKDTNEEPDLFAYFVEQLEKTALDVKVVEKGEIPKTIAIDEETLIGDDDVWAHIKAGIREKNEVDQIKLEALFRDLHKEALMRQV